MDSLIQPHWEALTPETRQAFYLSAHLPFINNYYLAGGTGLALLLGHRYSADLDFFSPDEAAVDANQRDSLRRLWNAPSLVVTYDTDGTFVASWQGVGVSFFRLPLYPLVQSPYLVDGVPLATIAEIGAMKLAAIINRGTRKDLVDLFYILQSAPVEKIFEVASLKYARIPGFPVSALRALAYFDDAEAVPMPRMIDQTPWTKMKRFLEKQALEAGRKNLSEYWEAG